MNTNTTNQRTCRDLEFQKLKDIVKGFAVSPLGRTSIEQMAPTSEKAKIEKELSRVKECQILLEKPKSFKLGEITDVSPLITQAQEHPPLETSEFLDINQTLTTGKEAKDYIFNQPEEEVPHLKKVAERIDNLESLQREIKSKIDRRGEIRDTATKKLFDLLNEKREAEKSVKSILEDFLSNHGNLVQDRVVTQKSNRLVVPLVSSAKERVDCVIHGSSNSGRTLFAEPSSAVKLNNRLKDLSSEIREEKKRIRRELTELVKDNKRKLKVNRAALKQLDSVYARAQFAGEYSCSFPKLVSKGGLSLIDARHPLLDQQEVVPVNIRFGNTEKGATITGPNTGGKTVTLKTIGLFSLMVQSGIPVPASPDSKMEVYDHVFSDIGDEQSIEQSLSTFSSHMGNIVGILEKIDEDSLVLLDELGAGTDPEEGAALGLAILERLLKEESRFAVTTHFTAIKNFSFNHPGLATFSADFDPEKLEPTYHLLEGVPGKSNAFIIASRLGLGEEIISRAESFLDQGKIQAENIIQDLVQEKRKIRKKNEEIDEKLSKAQQTKEEYERKFAKLEADQKNALSSKLRELDRSIEDAKRRIEEAISQARESGEEGARKALKEVEQLQKTIQAGKKALRKDEEEKTLSLEELQPGRKVEVTSTGQQGEVVRAKDKDQIEVAINGIKIKTRLSDLNPPEDTEKDENSKSEVSYNKTSRPAGLQINVRGMTVREAIRAVDKYIDRIIRSDRTTGRILHGKGTGKLRKNIRSHLRSHGLVKKCYGPPPAEGGEGVTVFEL